MFYIDRLRCSMNDRRMYHPNLWLKISQLIEHITHHLGLNRNLLSVLIFHQENEIELPNSNDAFTKRLTDNSKEEKTVINMVTHRHTRVNIHTHRARLTHAYSFPFRMHSLLPLCCECCVSVCVRVYIEHSSNINFIGFLSWNAISVLFYPHPSPLNARFILTRLSIL